MKPSKTARNPHLARSGFTLVELLVVILIIAVLAVLSFSIATRVRDQAVTSADINKFRQVAAALASISQDNNGIIPHGAKNKDGYGIPGTEAIPGDGIRYSFHEAIDRYFPPVPKFNPSSIYNYDLREGPDAIFSSKAVKPYQGYSQSPNRKLVGPLWFSFNANLNNATNWAGRLSSIPDPSKIVICGETNHPGGEMKPRDTATFSNNVETRYRVSRPGKTALYLFVDGHVEQLAGDRGEAYYAANPDETNIWKWW